MLHKATGEVLSYFEAFFFELCAQIDFEDPRDPRVEVINSEITLQPCNPLSVILVEIFSQ